MPVGQADFLPWAESRNIDALAYKGGLLGGEVTLNEAKVGKFGGSVGVLTQIIRDGDIVVATAIARAIGTIATPLAGISVAIEGAQDPSVFGAFAVGGVSGYTGASYAATFARNGVTFGTVAASGLSGFLGGGFAAVGIYDYSKFISGNWQNLEAKSPAAAYAAEGNMVASSGDPLFMFLGLPVIRYTVQQNFGNYILD